MFGLLFVGSLLLSAWLAIHAPGDAFYLAPARAFQLLTGALVALNVAPAVKSATSRDNLSIIGLALIVVSLAVIDDHMPVPGLPALAPCLGVAMLLHAGRDGPTRAGRWISNPVFLFFGAISYSLYLWHWPLLVYAREISFGRPAPLLIAAAAALAVVLGYLSYRFIEQPFLRGRRATVPTLAGGVAVMAAGAVAGLVLFLSDGAPSRFSPRALALFAGAEDYSAHRTECHQEDSTPIAYDQNCQFGADGGAPTIAVWGDSYGIELAAALGERVAPRGQAVMQITATLCPPALYYDPARRPLCAQRNIEALERLSADARIRTVVLFANLPHYGEKDAGRIAAGYRAVVSRLVAAGKQVVLVAPTPMMPNDPPRALGAWAARGRDPYAYGVTRVEHETRSAWAARLLTDIARTNQVDVVDPADLLCDSLCRAVGPDRERPLYYDRAHLSMSGARLLAERLPLGGE